MVALLDKGDETVTVLWQTLDYETVNPKTQALTLTATQRVGVVDITNNVSVSGSLFVFDFVSEWYNADDLFFVEVNLSLLRAQSQWTGRQLHIQYVMMK